MPVLAWSLNTSPHDGFSRKRLMFPWSSVTTTPYSSGFGTEWSTIVACEPRSVCARITVVRSMSVRASPLITRKVSSRRWAALRTLPAVPRGRSSTTYSISMSSSAPSPRRLRISAPRYASVTTTWVIPCSLSSRRMCSSTGVPTTGTSGLGRRLVSGRSRAPSPPAMTTAFTRPPPRHRSADSDHMAGCEELRARGWSAGREHHPLMHAHEAKPLEQPGDDDRPGKVRGVQTRRDAQPFAQRRLLDQTTQRAGDLGRIVGLDHDGVAVRAGVLLAGRAHHRDPARGHRLESDETEGLVPGVGEHRGRASVDLGDHLVGEESTKVHDWRAVGLGERAHDAAGVFDRFVPVGHGQPALGGEFEHRGAVRLHPATHEHATGHALGTKFREGGDGLVPAFVRAEAADLEREAR